MRPKSRLDATHQLEPKAVDDEELRLGELLVVAGREWAHRHARRTLPSIGRMLATRAA